MQQHGASAAKAFVFTDGVAHDLACGGGGGVADASSDDGCLIMDFEDFSGPGAAEAFTGHGDRKRFIGFRSVRHGGGVDDGSSGAAASLWGRPARMGLEGT